MFFVYKLTTPAINSLKNFLASDSGIPTSGSNFQKIFVYIRVLTIQFLVIIIN